MGSPKLSVQPSRHHCPSKFSHRYKPSKNLRKCRKQRPKPSSLPLRKSRAPKGRPKTSSRMPRNKRRRKTDPPTAKLRPRPKRTAPKKKRKTERERRKKKETIKNRIVFSLKSIQNRTIPNTPPHPTNSPSLKRSSTACARPIYDHRRRQEIYC